MKRFPHPRAYKTLLWIGLALHIPFGLLSLLSPTHALRDLILLIAIPLLGRYTGHQQNRLLLLSALAVWSTANTSTWPAMGAFAPWPIFVLCALVFSSPGPFTERRIERESKVRRTAAWVSVVVFVVTFVSCVIVGEWWSGVGLLALMAIALILTATTHRYAARIALVSWTSVRRHSPAHWQLPFRNPSGVIPALPALSQIENLPN